MKKEWRKSELGSDNGKPMFDPLKTEIEAYNAAMGSKVGCVNRILVLSKRAPF